jgi:hypothetical protein
MAKKRLFFRSLNARPPISRSNVERTMETTLLLLLGTAALTVQLVGRLREDASSPERDDRASTQVLEHRAGSLGARPLSRTIDAYVHFLRGRERVLTSPSLPLALEPWVHRDIAQARKGLSLYLAESRKRGHARS